VRRRVTISGVRRRVLLPACLLLVAGASGAHGSPSPSLRPFSCNLGPDIGCALLPVPLDHSHHARGTLSLAVAQLHPGSRKLPVLVVLTGGPGQPGASFLPRVETWLGPVAQRYRVVMIDQRGTGGGALQCPQLQAVMGGSDLTVPPPTAVTRCAAAIGPQRRYYTTTDTVEDLDALRQALGVKRISLDGISYGTYVAERYALAHPQSVSRLVLDSVVPHDGHDLALYTAALGRAAIVLRAVCAANHCGSDPAADLAAVVRAHHDGPQILDGIVSQSVFDPTYSGTNSALHAAREGNLAPLDTLLRGIRAGDRAPAAALSQGLHASTLCEDLPFPWGRSNASLAGRSAALARAASRLTDAQVWPFDRATVSGNGLVQTCLRWPVTPAPPLGPGGLLPNVPTLLLAGDRDLSTPLPWAQWEAAHAPGGHLVIVPGAGHSVQSRAQSSAGRDAMQRFLSG
jgi:pimeloyl-ACP methyl ester carboxylesterase